MQVDSSPVPLKRCPFCGEYPEPSIDVMRFMFTYRCPHDHLWIEIDASAGTFTRCRAWNRCVDDAERFAIERIESCK